MAKCSMCKEQLPLLHMGVRCNRCQRKLERDSYRKPLKEKIAKLEIELAATRELSERRRVLLEKHEWLYSDYPERYCAECNNFESEGHKPDCAWDAALRDMGRE